MICNDNICIHHVLLLVLLLIFAYGYIINRLVDFLESKFSNCEGCDYWSITHIILYTILSYNFPSYYLLLFLIGIGWEYFEYLIGNIKSFKLKSIDSEEEKIWWYGRYSDIAFNTLGIMLGILLSPYKIKMNKYIIV